ncbi:MULTISPECIES: polyprenol phosphomannose-dependent alpha 1,6 mannosyltransferase MptB [unclassified Nocardioides]|uniref:polyprenol phosphomannose-dependent alpha 1,6 mannosyltransferase MptB n=1 Tax=unclassified Nocardioides TaxID=2615069 RepID=UPI0000571687|nr:MULTISPECIES: polyprenol phosphomannose-dependent alpha 1,6 mannosyltransferase MptB [unclassified Nocardioides]ABL81069.1 conserved hypothetical protein [Nocardioides sp. JS614]
MTIGSYAYAPMPTPPALLRATPLGAALTALRASDGARTWGLVLCFTGVTVLTLAWFALGVAVKNEESGVRRVTLTGLTWSVPLLLAPPMFSGDGWSYAAYGYLTGHDMSPYVVPPSVLHGPLIDAVCSCWRDTPAPYGPVPLLWGGAFSRFTASPWLLLAAYRLLALLGLGMLMYAAPRLARIAGRHPARAAWLVASPLVLAHGVGGVHLDLVMVGLVATALAFMFSLPSQTLPRRRESARAMASGWFTGAVGIGLATAVKAPAVVAGLGVALVALPREATTAARLRAGARVGFLAVGTTGVIGVLAGLGVGWLITIHATLVLHTPLSLTYDVGTWVSGLTGHNAAPVVDVIGIVVLIGACGVILCRSRTGEPGAALGAAAVAMLLTTVLSPVTNYWYYLWCLPLLACCRLPAWARRSLTALVGVLGLLAPLDPALHVPGTGNIQLAAALGAVLLAAGAPIARDLVDRAAKQSQTPPAPAGRTAADAIGAPGGHTDVADGVASRSRPLG